MDEGLAGRQRQYEGLIHNLSKELNLCKAANQDLNSKIRDMCGMGDQTKSKPLVKCHNYCSVYFIVSLLIFHNMAVGLSRFA